MTAPRTFDHTNVRKLLVDRFGEVGAPVEVFDDMLNNESNLRLTVRALVRKLEQVRPGTSTVRDANIVLGYYRNRGYLEDEEGDGEEDEEVGGMEGYV